MTNNNIFAEKLEKVTDQLFVLLSKKNEKYGNAALEPLNIFSKLDSTNSILIRLDDKISRIKNSDELRRNDVADILGYLVLLCIDKEWSFEDLID